jgi:hypothetical protein
MNDYVRALMARSTAMQPPEVITVVIEYSPTQKRVMVRGVFRQGDPLPTLIDPENYQNCVKCYAGMDMGRHVGFSNLAAEESPQ